MKLDLSFDGNETPDDVNRAFAAALLFCGQIAANAPASLSTGIELSAAGAATLVDTTNVGFGGAAATGGDDEGDEAGTPNGAAVDSAGLPWDARIHSEKKTTIANGTWKKKRGVEPTLIATVEAELRALMGVSTPAAAAAPPPPPAAAAAPPPPPAATGAAPPPPPAAAAAAAPPPPPAVAAATNAAPASFGTMMAYFTRVTQREKLMTPEQGDDILRAFGLQDPNTGAGSITALISNPSLIPQVWEAMQAVIAENAAKSEG